jgi:peptidoglycan-associated lipoprotein
LQKNPTIKIEIAGHTDNKGDDKYNQTLSQKRAESVVNYLIKKGIAKTRLVAKGYGEQRQLHQTTPKKTKLKTEEPK